MNMQITANAGSFRDPANRVYEIAGQDKERRILRGVDASTLKDFQDLSREAFLIALQARFPSSLASTNSNKPARPSWCLTPRTATEQTICSDPLLSELDLKLDGLYKSRWETLRGVERTVFVDRQNIWRRTRDLCGAYHSCLVNQYRLRLRDFGE